MSIFPTKVLLATDGSKEAQLAATAAADLAKRTGSELHLVYVGHMPPAYYESPGAWALDPDLRGRMAERVEEEARTRLDEQVQRVREAGGEVGGAHAKLGRPDAEIVGLAEELGAGLIVLGSRGLGGIRRALMGSVSDAVVSHAHCPVLVVRDGEGDFLPARILLALDGSKVAGAAASFAMDLANRTDSELHVVHVGEVTAVYHPERHGYLAHFEELQEEARRLLNAQVDEIRSAGGTVAEVHLRMGRPEEEIVVLGEEIGAGLIVTGSRGVGGIRRALMGSVSESVVRHAHCPVMVVRPEKEQTA